MGFGDALKSAWNSATSAVKSGAQWVGDKLKSGTRSAVTGVADKVYTEKNTQRAESVKNAFGKVKDYFSSKPPAQPCVNCAAKDVDYDGTLVGYKDGKCVPMTRKGEPIGADQVNAAKDSGYDPQNNPADNTSDSVKACCAKCSPGGAKRTIYYVNGINTDKKTHCDTLKQIGDSTCANVVGIYNATEPNSPGQFAMRDAAQTAKDRELIRSAQNGNTKLAHDGRNPAVDTLSDLIVQERQAGNTPEIWAHSQGGAVTSLALYDASNALKAGPPGPNSNLDGVKVNSFGSAAPAWVDGPNYTHYVNVNDATPMAFGLGDKPSYHAKNAGGGNVVTFSGDPRKAGEPNKPFNTADPDKHWFPSTTEYHGVDNVYIPMYEQQNKKSEACSCNK